MAATDEVAFYYDSQTLPSGAPSFDRGYSTGALVAVTYGAGSAGTYRGYDVLGRVVRQYQQTDSVNYLVEASYSVGTMTSETYSSVPGASDRRTVTYGYDNAGRLGYFNSNATSYAPGATVTSMGYASHNALKAETYGNSLVHAISYNNRLQPTEIKLGTSSNSTSVIDLTYSYGTTANNGDVLSASYNGGGLSYTQTFTYDSLNRLQTAQENSGSNWSQTNGYDQYGNRWIDYGGGSHNLAFSTSTNRITTSGFTYDSSGNLTNDTAHAYTFDAENKILKVDSTTAYAYDGEGHRVRKYVGENTRFVYGIGGQLIAEYDGSSGNLKKEYMAGGGSMITIEPTAANSNGTQYTTSDNLGSPRVVTNSSGSVVGRHDYMPFGEELGAGVGGRTTGMGFSNGGDNNRKKFTGYERDTETSLDFAQARYDSSTQGRFTSPDPLMSSGKVADPQSWNRYSYCFNNPVALTDPSGMEVPKGPSDSQWLAGMRGGTPGDIEVLEGTQYTNGEVSGGYAEVVAYGIYGSTAGTSSNEESQGISQQQAAAVTVGPPARLNLISATLIPEGQVGGRPKGGQFGIRVEVVYQVEDKDGNVIMSPVMVPMEQIFASISAVGAAPQTYSINPDKPAPLGPVAGTKNTGKSNNEGKFTDAPLGRYFPTSFNELGSQKLFIQRPGDAKPIPVGVTQIQTGNTSITITYVAPKGVAGPAKQVIKVSQK